MNNSVEIRTVNSCITVALSLVTVHDYTSEKGEYKTKTEDLRPKNEDPFKIVLKSLKKGSNMILDQSRNKEHQDLQLSTNLTRVFVSYITLPKGIMCIKGGLGRYFSRLSVDISADYRPIVDR